MKFQASIGCITFLALVVVTGSAAIASDDGRPPLKQGDAITLIAREGVVTKLDTLPYVESEYTKRYKFDSFDNPKLKELRDRYHLDEVVAPGKTEFDRQVLLLDWVNHRFKKFGKPSSPARGALDVLAAVDEGHSFFCSQYGDVLVSAAASLGWVDRPLALRRPDSRGHGSTEHTSTEIWSTQYRKWVLFDPTFAMYVEKDGVPLNAYEFRQEWFYHDGTDVVFVMDKDRKRVHKSDMPVLRGRYAGFGDLVFDPGATDVYAFIGYVPNTDLLDRGSDWGNMFITRDKICDGTQWHKRPSPADPARDPYFPINQAAVTLTIEGPALRVRLKTLTPNFKTYLIRLDGGEWTDQRETFAWVPRNGANHLEIKTVNQFGVDGPISTVELEMKTGRKDEGDRRPSK
ncbi:MAG: transglutaminase domain protein [Phycisphaerales bacterium]|nr:transglutaminase domain protein [Phycisphaerales bacterium]